MLDRYMERWFIAFIAFAIAATASVARAQSEYPVKPVTLIVAFPPGQATDLVARLLADELSKMWGKAVIVENRAGGNSVPGTMAGRNAPPDGYTITFATSSSIAVNRALYAQLPYDPPNDFTMVHGVFRVPWVIVANPGVPYGTLKELIDAAKQDPGKLSWGYGATSLQLGAELFKLRTGAELVGVPYKGSGPAIADLIGGHVPLLLDTVAATLPHIRSGRMKAIATMAPTRVSLLPDVPTVAELGYPGFEADGWGGVVVPKATPSAIVNKIGADVKKILNDPAIQRQMLDRGVVPDLRGPEDWTAFVNAELKKWSDVARRANVKAD